jgi:tetratricopeptide (TPR) repeat protein
VSDPLGILELRSAVAGAPPGLVRQVLDHRLPAVAPPATAVEFDAWMWALYDLGLAAETLPDYPRALDLYARSIECNRTSALLRSAALVRTGLCLEHLGRWSQAVEAYRQADEGSSGWPASRALMLWRLGRLLRAAEDFAEASAVLEKLIPMLPQPGISEPEARLEYAVCLEHSGRAEQALAVLERLAGEAHPAAAEAHPEAVQAPSAAAEAHPAAVQAMIRLASLQLRLGRPRDASLVLRRITNHPAAEAAIRAAASIRLSQISKD